MFNGQQILDRNRGVAGLKEDKAFFTSGVHINLKSIDVEKLINKCIKKIIEQIEIYEKNGSGWYFKEAVQLEIHTVELNPTKGSTYIPLPDWISDKKKPELIFKTKMKNVFFGVYLDIFIKEIKMIPD